jgi:hypothetical protein
LLNKGRHSTLARGYGIKGDLYATLILKAAVNFGMNVMIVRMFSVNMSSTTAFTSQAGEKIF